MSTVNRVVKNTLFLYARMGTSIVVSVLTTRILLNALGASDYGLYNVVAGALAMLGFLSASMSSASLRYMSYAEGKGDITVSDGKKIQTNGIIVGYAYNGISNNNAAFVFDKPGTY